ncbi:MAG TPA: hypothetical protein PKC67_05320 [Kiritimatiellia bacterium]|nr:hypothetical protein [Kiritimatiellia bacterium]HMP33753.1 hypothetical protein [Kiritimatiellia bacterium]
MKSIMIALSIAAIALCSGCCSICSKKSESACNCKGGADCTCAENCTCKS